MSILTAANVSSAEDVSYTPLESFAESTDIGPISGYAQNLQSTDTTIEQNVQNQQVTNRPISRQKIKTIEPVRGFEWGYIGLIILIIILIVIIIYLITLSRVNTNLVDPSTCPKIKGVYATQPNTSGTIISQCGISGTEACTTTATSLVDAMAYCETYISVCNAFSYSSKNSVVHIINPDVLPSDDADFDTYYRQTVTG